MGVNKIESQLLDGSETALTMGLNKNGKQHGGILIKSLSPCIILDDLGILINLNKSLMNLVNLGWFFG